jgi:hypothetical protein
MLSAWDDYPVHQTSYPVAHPASNDPGRYDRYWMTMLDTDLTTQLGFGLPEPRHHRRGDQRLAWRTPGRRLRVRTTRP